MLRTIAFLVALLPAVALAEFRGTAQVIDGDTLVIAGKTVRLFGIDAPEPAQTCQSNDHQYACGQLAGRVLARIVDRSWLWCDNRGLDLAGRTVAICRIGAGDLSAAMVRAGWALAYRDLSADYGVLEDQARLARRGLWAGVLVSPWAWRDGERLPAPEGDKRCLIKGTVGETGQRVYYWPDNPRYDEIAVVAARGERMFCTEPEAQADGWRRAAQ
jgi:endonuclease YncB( thermonuclease family)